MMRLTHHDSAFRVCASFNFLHAVFVQVINNKKQSSCPTGLCSLKGKLEALLHVHTHMRTRSHTHTHTHIHTNANSCACVHAHTQTQAHLESTHKGVN